MILLSLVPKAIPWSLSRRSWGVVLTVLLVGSGGLWYCFWRYQAKRFQVVRAGVLYRAGQPTEFGFDHLVKHHGVKTVLSLQLYDCQLHQGWLDLGEADGAMESSYVRRLGIDHQQWWMGNEACWPWFSPWQFEAFFALFDNPEHFPVAVHCMGGRHRTGTVSALFRLEYDRWGVEPTLREMFSFEFGPPAGIQEHNLRTYLPRPVPTAHEWEALRRAFVPQVVASADDYPTLVRALRQRMSDASVTPVVEQYLREHKPFALALVARLIDQPSDPFASEATRQATELLDQNEPVAHELSVAAALIADFGTIEQQSALIQRLEQASRTARVSPWYAAVVAGVTNRYTLNRLPFLLPLLDDERRRPEPDAAQYRYCDTAVARIAVITDQASLGAFSTFARRDQSREACRRWFTEHHEVTQLSQLIMPRPVQPVLVGDGKPPELPQLLQR